MQCASVIGGDTYFGEFYQEKRERNAELNYLSAFGYDYSGEKIAPLFRRSAICSGQSRVHVDEKTDFGS